MDRRAIAAEKREKVLGTLKQFSAEKGYSPTLDELAELSGIPKGTVAYHVRCLAEQGRIKRVDGKHRSITVAGNEIDVVW